MKKIALCCFLVCLFVQSHAQKNVAGIWEGKLNIGVDISIVFHFAKDSAGMYKGTMDSPDQNARGIPFSNVTVIDDSVIAAVQIINGVFNGRMKNDSVLSGRWTQNTHSFPLVVKKALMVSTDMPKPQTPKPPFNYNTEDVEFDNSDKSVHFGATFTYPKSGGNFPTAILITGSGQQDRDETIFQHKPFAVIADYLTKKGYAVLRVDDRGMGKTTGSLVNVTTADFARDIEAAITYIKTRKETDTTKIGLIGHSEGGLIADMVAAKDSSISFIVMLAGPGLQGSEVLRLQMNAIIDSSKLSSQTTMAYKAIYEKALHNVLNEPDSAKVFSKTWSDYVAWKNKYGPAVLNELEIRTDADARQMINNLVNELQQPWFKYFITSTPAAYIEKFYCKVLALNGEKDMQVIAKPNLDAIKEALEKSKSKSFETKQLAGLNHLFQHCITCNINEYATLDETFAPEALAEISNWLDANIKNK